MDRAKMESAGEGEACGIRSAFGSFTDPAFVSAEPPVGPLGRLAGRVDTLWSGAVLHVLSRQDVQAFAAHAHAMLAPGGVWIGVGCTVACACRLLASRMLCHACMAVMSPEPPDGGARLRPSQLSLITERGGPTPAESLFLACRPAAAQRSRASGRRRPTAKRPGGCTAPSRWPC